MSSAAGDTAAARRNGTPAEVVTRAALDHELDAAGAVVRAAYEADGLVHGDYLAILADARDRSRDAVVAVAVGSDGAVVGSVTFTLPGSRWAELARAGQAEFRMLGVLPEARGHGVGRALVDWCVAQARAAGAREVVISSAAAMAAAHHLYTTRGFTRRPDLDWSPAPGVDLLGFVLELPAAR